MGRQEAEAQVGKQVPGCAVLLGDILRGLLHKLERAIIFRSQAPQIFSALYYPELRYEPNILRTKPGRLDLPIHKRTSTLSCSDLIGLFNLVGIQGLSLLSLVTPVYVSTFIVEGPQ